MNESTMSNTSRGLMILRGVIYVIFGIVAFFFPGAGLLGLAIFFGILLLIEALIMFVDAGVSRNWGSLFIGIFDLVIGLLVIFNPGISAVVFVWLITLWAFMGGIVLFSAGLAADKTAPKGLMITGGILLALLGLYLIFQPILFQTLTIVYFIGGVAIITGLILFFSALMNRGSTKGSLPVGTKA